jgi:hypothetical protein
LVFKKFPKIFDRLAKIIEISPGDLQKDVALTIARYDVQNDEAAYSG